MFGCLVMAVLSGATFWFMALAIQGLRSDSDRASVFVVCAIGCVFAIAAKRLFPTRAKFERKEAARKQAKG